MPSLIATASATLAIGLMLAGCSRNAAPGPSALTAPSRPALGGDLAGGAWDTRAASIRNPLEGQAQAIEAGHRLFVQMNCAGCHGYDLGGSMGPNLTDRYWRYGGTPAAIYQSISQGRPQGMPAWGRALPPDQIWALIAFIQSKGGTTPASDYRAGRQGDELAEPGQPKQGSATGAQSTARGGTSQSAQAPNP